MARLLVVLLLLIGFAAPAAAADDAGGWWNKDWSYRRSVTIDTTGSGVNVNGAIGRTVVLIRLHSGNFNFPDALKNGADLRLVDGDDKTPLPFHIESYDQANGLAALWVSVPNLNGGEKHKIWLYYGNGNAPAGADAKGTFDPDYLAVYHFGENAGQPASDSTANANSSQNPPAGISEAGIVGRSARFPGQGELQISATASLAMTAGSPLTFSVWVKPAALTGQQTLFARGPLVFGLNAGVPYLQVGGQLVPGKTPVKQGAWTHVAFAADGQNVHIYVNGTEDGLAAMALPALDGPISLGGSAGQPFNGELDEARISKTPRPAGMMMVMAQGEGPGGKLVSVSEAPEKPEGGQSTIGFIITKLEFVDSIVIGLCMILLSLAATVMISKSRYVGAAQKANKAFLRRFYAMHEQLVPLGMIEGITPKERARLTASPLGRIYETGMEELNVRKQRWGAVPLSGEAIEAMRAAVTSEYVDENQKLDSWMVVLTIAIAGGPFIGLLGTVLGVMNTFGGVAMAGDVNVNAIAPGIAAALLATIAGLTCAIPSLFGYNYLNSQITPLTDEMRTFIDRLIARLAEMQRDEAVASASFQ